MRSTLLTTGKIIGFLVGFCVMTTIISLVLWIRRDAFSLHTVALAASIVLAISIVGYTLKRYVA